MLLEIEDLQMYSMDEKHTGSTFSHCPQPSHPLPSAAERDQLPCTHLARTAHTHLFAAGFAPERTGMQINACSKAQVQKPGVGLTKLVSARCCDRSHDACQFGAWKFPSPLQCPHARRHHSLGTGQWPHRRWVSLLLPHPPLQPRHACAILFLA